MLSKDSFLGRCTLCGTRVKRCGGFASGWTGRYCLLTNTEETLMSFCDNAEHRHTHNNVPTNQHSVLQAGKWNFEDRNNMKIYHRHHSERSAMLFHQQCFKIWRQRFPVTEKTMTEKILKLFFASSEDWNTRRPLSYTQNLYFASRFWRQELPKLTLESCYSKTKRPVRQITSSDSIQEADAVFDILLLNSSSYLLTEDLCQCLATSRLWNHLASRHFIWRQVVEAQYDGKIFHVIDRHQGSSIDWIELYFQFRQRNLRLWNYIRIQLVLEDFEKLLL